MELAEKCAGFPKDKCDEVRRAIMKRSISGGAAAQKAAKETRDSFVEGCIKNGYTSQVANNLYDKILYFAGYGFNKSHAVAYGIDSFWCAWLLTYHEEEWLTAYMESMSTTPEKRAKAFGEIKKLGYQIVPIDINLASENWRVLPGKKFMPSFLSCKGVGSSAIEEIIEKRPYNSIEELLWDDDFKWKHSKFNKKAFESLVKIGAFGSMDVVGEGKIFNSYRHMHETLFGSHVESVTKKRKGIETTEDVELDHSVLVKRATRADPHEGLKNFYELVRRCADVEDWTSSEKAENMVEVFGTVDVAMMIEPEILERLDQKSVRSIDDIDEGEKDLVWFCVQKTIPKTSKNGKKYLLIEAVGLSGKATKVFCWGWDGIRSFKPYAMCLAEVERNEFGCTTTVWKLKEVA
jgi:DNA polymerase III alpha subunit